MIGAQYITEQKLLRPRRPKFAWKQQLSHVGSGLEKRLLNDFGHVYSIGQKASYISNKN